MDQITIRIPATTANLGPGYDCLGVALQLYNHVTVRRVSHAAACEHAGLPGEAASRFFARSAFEPFPFAWEIAGDVPRSRGLGSSVTVRLGLLHGLNWLAEQPLSNQPLFDLCAELEGHPDNAAPAAFGGFTIAGGPDVVRFEVAPELRFVLLIPGFEIATPDARRALPETIARLGAAQSCANACRIVGAFARHDYRALRGAFGDSLHQPYREKALIPFLSAVIREGEYAGALGGFLSGSGSTICCVTLENAEAVAAAMLRAAPTGSRTVVTRADNRGVINDR
jgi:homoserine kinase